MKILHQREFTETNGMRTTAFVVDQELFDQAVNITSSDPSEPVGIDMATKESEFVKNLLPVPDGVDLVMFILVGSWRELINGEPDRGPVTAAIMTDMEFAIQQATT